MPNQNKILRICLAQINPKVGDLRGNADKIVAYIEKARALKADVVAFPELSLSGYPPEDLLLKPHFVKENMVRLSGIVKFSKGIFCVIGLPYSEKGRLYNAAALVYDGKLVDVYKKILLPNYGVFDEKRYFSSGDTCNIVSFAGDVKMGVTICEDMWHEAGPSATQALGGAGVIINISASPYHARKVSERRRIFADRAKEANAYVACCNLVGGQDELVFDGSSFVIDSAGRLLTMAKQFEEELVTADIRLGAFGKARAPAKQISYLLPRSSIRIKKLPAIKPKAPVSCANRVEKVYDFLDEIYVALVLGLGDYVRKNGFSKVVLGLSGGIDSALVAVLACDALGSDNVIALTMPSVYSSAGTKRDARKIAAQLKVRLITIPIGKIYSSYLGATAKFFRGRKPDVTEQNIQARIRGNLLMAFSNKFCWLLISTGNKSEVSTGYCTLYGDMAGGFAILRDVPKGLVYRLAKRRNDRAGCDIIPRSVLRRVPSAELKNKQTDQDILPPYPVLDRIIDLYVEKNMSLEAIVKQGINRNIASCVISMIDRNEYKRRQSAPGIKITPRAFGRDRRMPITNAFFG